MIWIAIGLLAAYSIFVFRLTWAWKGIEAYKSKNSNEFVSVIVPVRNEEKNVLTTIETILKSNYAYELFEILVVNDHSTDGTREVINSIESSNVRSLDLPDACEGKKAAITYAVDRAKGDFIVCTDGDTLVSNGWLSTHVAALSLGEMAFGPVEFEGHGLKVEMLNMELMSLVGVGGAMMSIGKPSMINGCNYSFSKNFFLEVGGFDGNEHLSTGDDEFLLRKVVKAGGRVKFLKSKNALVRTEPVKSFIEFFHQRKRWASKWRHHRDLSSKALPALVFVFYAAFYTVLGINVKQDPLLVFGAIFLKCTVDYIFVFRIMKTFEKKVSIGVFNLLQIIYPFYAVFFGLASNFGQYLWKDRNHQI